MADDVSDIAAFYDQQPDREHNRLAVNQLEYDLTWRYLEEYLPPRCAVLELGAATGRYTIELAKRGHQITAVDISAQLLSRARATITEHGLANRVAFIVGDARHLSTLTKTFDAVLMMGPLYHLPEVDDRRAAVHRAHQALHVGGVIFSAFLSRLGVIGDFMRRVPEWIEDQEQVESFMTLGRRPDGRPSGGFRGYFAQPSEIVPLHESEGFETIAFSGVEPAISAYDESYNNLVGKRRQLWLDLLYKLSSDQSMIAASRHLLYVGSKSR